MQFPLISLPGTLSTLIQSGVYAGECHGTVREDLLAKRR